MNLLSTFSKIENKIIISGFFIFLLFPLFIKTTFPIHLMITVFMYSILGISWNILGSSGIVSLGQTVFFGLGAYVVGVFNIKYGINPWIGLILAILINSILGYLLGKIFSKLAGHYYAIATIALAEITRTLIMNWKYVGGSVGLFIPFEKTNSWIAFQFVTTKNPYYFIIFIFFITIIIFNKYLLNSKYGYYLKAMKESKDASLSLGVNIRNIKTTAIIISAIIATIPGVFMAQYTLYLSHETFFEFRTSLYALLVAVVGGVGYLWGPFIGALILVPISEIFRVYVGGTGRAIDLIIYALIIMIMALYQPNGILGIYKAKITKSCKDRCNEKTCD